MHTTGNWEVVQKGKGKGKGKGNSQNSQRQPNWRRTGTERRSESERPWQETKKTDDRKCEYFTHNKDYASLYFDTLKKIGRDVSDSCTIYYHRDENRYEIRANTKSGIDRAKIALQNLYKSDIVKKEVKKTKNEKSNTGMYNTFNELVETDKQQEKEYPTLSYNSSNQMDDSIWSNQQLESVKNEESLVKKVESKPVYTSIKDDILIPKIQDEDDLIAEITRNMRARPYKRAVFLPDITYTPTLDEDWISEEEYDVEEDSESDCESEDSM